MKQVLSAEMFTGEIQYCFNSTSTSSCDTNIIYKRNTILSKSYGLQNYVMFK